MTASQIQFASAIRLKTFFFSLDVNSENISLTENAESL